MTIFINLYGGPGSGKSTTAAGVFHQLKLLGYNAEIVTEFAKDLTWEERTESLKNQIYVTGKQYHKCFRLFGKVDVIVTDSPMLLGALYARYYEGGLPDSYYELVSWCQDQTSTKGLNFFLNRAKPFNPKGRNQDLNTAKNLDESIKDLLVEFSIDYEPINGDEKAVDLIVDKLIRLTKTS